MSDVSIPLAHCLDDAPDLVKRIDELPVMRHPYGFYVLQTGRSIDGIAIRFHVWVPQLRIAQQPNWPPHSHRSGMISHVLSGSLENAQWDRFKMGYGKPLYVVTIEGTRSYMKRSSIEIELDAPTVLHVTAGHSYFVPNGVFHDTRVPADGHCLTLCLFSNDRKGQSVVVGEHGFPDSVESDRLAFSAHEAEQARAWCRKGLTEYIEGVAATSDAVGRRAKKAPGRSAGRSGAASAPPNKKPAAKKAAKKAAKR